PGDTVLRAYDCSGFSNQGGNLWRQARQAVRLYAENDDVHGAGVSQLANNARANLEIAFRAEDPEPTLLHRLQVRTPRKERDVLAGAGHAGANVAADCSGARNEEAHCLRPRERLGHRAALNLARCRARNRVRDVDFLGPLEV